jgi:hypothetical protein
VRVLLVSANRERFPSPVMPLGLLSVAEAIRGVHDVRVCDLCFAAEPHAALREALAAFQPEVVGVGIRNLHDNAYKDGARLNAEYLAVIEVIRATTDAPIVLGGPGFSLRPAALLETLGADYGVVGEGEAAFPALLDALAGVRPERRLWQAQARAFGPAWRAAVDPRYLAHDGTINVQTRRGCAFGCAYCGYPEIEGRTVRVRPVEEVVADIVVGAAMPGVSHAFFVDSVFNVPANHTRALCQGLADAGRPLPWVCYASPAGLDARMVASMAAAGCVGAEIGTDTGTAAGLARLRKPFGLDEVRAARAAFQAEGVADCHTFVLGAFAEGPDEVRRTLDFVAALDPDVAVFLVFVEDRADAPEGHARHRDAILALLGEAAIAHPRWVVPELNIRFGPKIHRFMGRHRRTGPAWLQLAATR